MGVLDLEYGEDAALEAVLRSINRTGDFCIHGRLFAPMPRLEVDGEGGELLVRHQGRETVADMNVEEPSELAFAAFYADCAHEVRPVTR